MFFKIKNIFTKYIKIKTKTMPNTTLHFITRLLSCTIRKARGTIESTPQDKKTPFFLLPQLILCLFLFPQPFSLSTVSCNLLIFLCFSLHRYPLELVPRLDPLPLSRLESEKTFSRKECPATPEMM